MTIDNKRVRSHAVKLRIATILNAIEEYDPEKEFSYLVAEQQRVFRVSVVAVLVAKETQGAIMRLLLDDGSGKITAYFFEENALASRVRVGEVLYVIGKTRRYNEERYLSPEVVRVVDPLWLKVRALELPSSTLTPQTAGIVSEEVVMPDLPRAKISSLIRTLDHGDGAPLEEVLAQSELKDSEKWIEKMLQEGNIFQNSPGKIKIL